MGTFDNIQFHPGDKCVVFHDTTNKWMKAIVNTVWLLTTPDGKRDVFYKVELIRKNNPKNSLWWYKGPIYIVVGPDKIGVLKLI